MTTPSKNKTLLALQKSLDEVPTLRTSYSSSANFKLWHKNTLNVIQRLFPSEETAFRYITYDAPSRSYSAYDALYYGDDTDEERNSYYLNGLTQASTLIQSLIFQVEHFWEDETLPSLPDPPVKHRIERIFERFHLVARQLAKRYAKRDTLEIQDEYDVQDLMHALLLLDFADVRREEGTGSFAGSNSRMDFLLKIEKIALEMKHSRPGLTTKQLGEELIVDIRRYKKTHPDCEFLYCFVYDPASLIANPRGIENDLSVTTDGLPVKVIIRP